jgi:hypothetical protein
MLLTYSGMKSEREHQWGGYQQSPLATPAVTATTHHVQGECTGGIVEEQICKSIYHWIEGGFAITSRPNQLAVCSEAAAQQDERPHPPTI